MNPVIKNEENYELLNFKFFVTYTILVILIYLYYLIKGLNIIQKFLLLFIL